MAYVRLSFQLVNTFLLCHPFGMKLSIVNKRTPEHAGVYKIHLDGELAYIGQSDGVVRRIKNHGAMPGGMCEQVGRFKGMRVGAIHVESTEIPCKLQRDSVERQLIATLWPPACIRGNPNRKG
jgi:hypothetical protein